MEGSNIDNIIVCARFVGLTGASGRSAELIHSLCQQLSVCFGKQPQEVPPEPSSLPSELKSLLGQARKEKKILLILDSLDQVLDAHDVFAATCVPVSVPAHVLTLITVTENDTPSPIREHLREFLPESAFISVEPLSFDKSRSILTHILGHSGRRLSSSQESVIMEKYTNAGSLPLYLRVASSFARGWTSYTPKDTVDVCKMGDEFRQ